MKKRDVVSLLIIKNDLDISGSSTIRTISTAYGVMR
jgi:hypothetical protein